ncbi:hypothetical protein DFH08DRAFT_931634 [Mycena albidolilacea]|uniref:Uncharacterized protein n=1 Tax=Mycena albidolilacea TaxID=1033008 RepID=A0AAD7AM00_9AGAR|nr:hypothetical protein DFH08DRAFT_931634 [Mycena albidolilacea]
MSARVHTNPSNRAKARDTLEKKVVFKSVLDSPFRVPWPSVPVNLQNTALACTLSLLDGVSDYQSARGQENRKRKQLQKDARPNKKKKIDANAPTGDPDVVLPDVGVPSEETDPPALPAALSHLLIGLNAVTKRLDAQIRSLRKTVSLNPDPTFESVTPIKVIVVCRADVDPQILIDHLPHEVAAFNSSKPDDPIKLIPLPKGAEATLAKAVGLRRVAVIAMDINMPGLAAFTSILESVPTVTAPWLTSLAASAAPVELIPTHVKQLRTTAPKDMKVAKQLRAEGKAAAKARKKSKPKRTGKNAATPTAL